MSACSCCAVLVTEGNGSATYGVLMAVNGAGRAPAGPVAEAVGAPEVLPAGAVINMLAVAVLLGARPIRRRERIG